MPHIVFTQYLLPREKQRQIRIDRPQSICDMARALEARGLVFECEMLSDYETVSLTVTNLIDEVDIAVQLVKNGPGVPDAVDKLICDAHRRLIRDLN